MHVLGLLQVKQGRRILHTTDSQPKFFFRATICLDQSEVSNTLILQSTLQLLLITHLANSLHEVLFYHIVPLSTNSKHTLKYKSDFYTRKSRNELKSTNRFCANISKICSIEAISELANRLVVNITMLGDWSSMNLENFESTLQAKIELTTGRLWNTRKIWNNSSTCSFGRLISTCSIMTITANQRDFPQFLRERQNNFLPSYPIFQDEEEQDPTRQVCAKKGAFREKIVQS